MFQGSFPALITPFVEGRIDEKAYAELVEWHIEQGSSGVVPAGTTGESPTLTTQEHERLISICVETAAGRAPVIAGAGSNATAESVALAQHAAKAGADAVMAIVPYYNKPTQEGLYQHYKAINDAIDIPIVIYNAPGRTSIDIADDTLVRLAGLANIAAVKDATNDLERPVALRTSLAEAGRDLTLLCGENATVAAFFAQGGQGWICVTGNVAPAACRQLVDAALAGDMASVSQLRDRLDPLQRALFAQTNPIPVKYACSKIGKCRNTLRLPLVPASKATRQAIDAALAHARLS
ncbi:MAG: 4-hydroxy-tetrahydrodipicolinate synthase [Pseudomonadota bacterium]